MVVLCSGLILLQMVSQLVAAKELRGTIYEIGNDTCHPLLSFTEALNMEEKIIRIGRAKNWARKTDCGEKNRFSFLLLHLPSSFCSRLFSLDNHKGQRVLVSTT